MPYEWQPARGDVQFLHLWPHRSLTQRGFVWFVGATAGLIALPLFPIFGTAVSWALLPFLAATIWALWFALRKNGRDRNIVEELTLSSEKIVLIRHEPKGKSLRWEANPHWVRPVLHPTSGPVPQYLTLQGGPREVELGAFLAEEERLSLRDELAKALDRARNP